MASKTEFLNDVYSRAIELGIPEPQARLAASQAALESNYGKSAPNNNYFGIKGKGSTLTTKEVVDGKTVSTSASFRKYGGLDESLKDWWDLVQRRWPDAASASTFEDAAAGLNAGGRGGYATDPSYVSKLATVSNNLLIPPGTIPSGGTALDALSQFGDDVTAPSSMAYSASSPSKSGTISPAMRASLASILKNPLPSPSPLVAPRNTLSEMMGTSIDPTAPISGNEAMWRSPGTKPVGVKTDFNPATLQTLSPPPLNGGMLAKPPKTNNGGMVERAPVIASASKPVPIPTNNGGMVERAPIAPMTKTITNPAWTAYNATLANIHDSREDAMIRATGIDPATGKKLVIPPKTITVTTPSAPAAANPIGAALGWLGDKAGALGSSAMGTIEGVGAALPVAVDTAKDNLVKGIMMSPEARSPFINGAIGSIGKSGREYLGNGMTLAKRWNPDLGQFETYTRRIAVPTGKVPFEDYNKRKIGGSKFTESIGGGHTKKLVGMAASPNIIGA